VLNIESDGDSSVIVKSIIDLRHNLGLKVVAEGVETIETKKMLHVFQCDEGQGYYFCRPVPGDAMTKFLLEPRLTAATHSSVATTPAQNHFSLAHT